ncbi:MAG: zinc dependent phospholipase C family protein [Syntrophobacteraceae bacterium]|nr:zinc dependent phospholipase C family protein [Syntrophobacteraceae bacterium]
MPKERFHLLLAEEALKVLGTAGDLPPFSREEKNGFLLGTLLPDVLFYDFPLFSFSRLGREAHRLQSPEGLDFLQEQIRKSKGRYSRDAVACLVGVAGHFLVDGYWHLFMRELNANSFGGKNGTSRYSEKCRHLWIESEIESYWMAKLGPPDGYFPIIEGFRRDIISIQACLTAFKEVLAELGRNSVPSESQISRCLTFQTLLLRQFALPRWSRWRAPLLSGRYTRFLGACLVPPLSVFDGATSAAPPRGADAATLCTRDFMNRSVTFLSSRLSMLL